MSTDIVARGMISKLNKKLDDAIDFLDDIIEGEMDDQMTEFIKTGETNPIVPDQFHFYYDINKKISYRWNGDSYYVSSPETIDCGSF